MISIMQPVSIQTTPSPRGGKGRGLQGFLLLLVLFLVSCTTENYDTGDDTYSYLTAELGEVYTGSDAKMQRFVSDDDAAVDFREGYGRDWAKTPDSLYRAYVVYDGKADRTGRHEAFTISQVPVLRILDAKELKEGLADDPIVWESMWESHNHRYLNLSLRVMMGDTGEEKVMQKVGVACEATFDREDGSHEYHLRFYHDQNDVPEYYSASTYVSIPLNAYQPGDEVVMTLNTYNGPLTRRITLQ